MVGDYTQLSIHREEIKQVTYYRYLGIHLDILLSWGGHVDYVCSRLQQTQTQGVWCQPEHNVLHGEQDQNMVPRPKLSFHRLSNHLFILL